MQQIPAGHGAVHTMATAAHPRPLLNNKKEEKEDNQFYCYEAT
jgi:hypothetical protein